ncbi:MAG: Uma2 family endonuclease [Pseudanabaena sp. ELA607]
MPAQLIEQSVAPRFGFTTEQYHLMHEVGVFQEGDRLELINGEITNMSPIGRKHVACIIRLDKLIQKKLGDRVMVSTQNSIYLDDNSQPQTDLAILKPRDDFYESGLPTPADILLIIEVADSSLDYDRHVKAPLYAAARIPEMWLFDVNQKLIEGYTQPSANGYKLIKRYDETDTLSLLAFPDVTFQWTELF